MTDHEATARKLGSAECLDPTHSKIAFVVVCRLCVAAAIAAAEAKGAGKHKFTPQKIHIWDCEVCGYEKTDDKHIPDNAEIAQLKAEVKLNLESADSMRAAWNAACGEITGLKAERDELQAQIAQLKAELEHVKTVEFPRKAEAVKRAAFVKLTALWHFSICPFDHCERCIQDESIIKAIRNEQAEIAKHKEKAG